MNEVIEVRGLRLSGAHGVTEAERSRLQPFEVDLDVELDSGVASQTDDLNDAADYAQAIAAAAKVVEGPSHRLLESLARAIADGVLAQPHVAAVTVAIRKLRPPVPYDIVSAGVRISLRR